MITRRLRLLDFENLMNEVCDSSQSRTNADCTALQFPVNSLLKYSNTVQPAVWLRHWLPESQAPCPLCCKGCGMSHEHVDCQCPSCPFQRLIMVVTGFWVSFPLKLWTPIQGSKDGKPTCALNSLPLFYLSVLKRIPRSNIENFIFIFLTSGTKANCG